ncbi:hypothetical protein AVEN_7400-1 [Araneus ventricosus]|uniref:BACK domain-containing protein n=1 Tax=Araneus ventricosus TaxID=182803 RepID=A0A4Y2S4N1_ARAVE|nr:hypothetical protein AVEN_7400-1 [Araneus ventricosus]
MYHIDDLEKLCSNYITKEEVNIDNLFVKYESALSCKFPKLLEKCRNLVQSETKAVFASRYFGDAPFGVVEDIFSLDHLNVSSEFDVIAAAFRWSECECRRKGRPTEKLCIRDAIDPLLKHLRFLSISADEFCDFAAKDDNIFTAYETALLTRQMLQPDNKGNFPEYLCPISKPRQPYRRTSNHTVGMNNFSDFYSEPFNKNTFKDPYPVPDKKNAFQDPYFDPFNKNTFKAPSVPNKKNAFQDPYSEPDNKNAFKAPSSEPFLRSFSEPVNANNLNDRFSIQASMNTFSDYHPESTSGNVSVGQVNNLKSGQDDPLFFRQSLDKTSPTLTKTEQKPIFHYNQNQKKSTPMLKVMPQQGGAPTGRRTFDFPLREMQKNIGFASSKDIKCNAKIQMRAGAILIHGIELKISEQKYNPDESIEVLSCISNNYPSKVETFNLKLKNSTLSVMYPEPVKVTPENPTDIEITIEDLLLNRCFVCQGQNYELNCGLNVSAEISVKSNQSNGQDIVLYLISRIIYSMTSQF